MAGRHRIRRRARGRIAELPTAGPLVPGPARRRSTPKDPDAPAASAVRAWALAQGLAVADRGRLHADLIAAYRESNPR